MGGGGWGVGGGGLKTHSSRALSVPECPRDRLSLTDRYIISSISAP